MNVCECQDEQEHKEVLARKGNWIIVRDETGTYFELVD